MPRYLYVASDLSRIGVLETAALASTTERHLVPLEVPALRSSDAPIADLVSRDGFDGALLQLTCGAIGRGHLRTADGVLRAGRRLWLHWPAEGAVECVDAERLESLWRHCVGRALLAYGVDPMYRGWIGLTRLPAAMAWAVRGRFPIHQPKALDWLQALYERASPVAFPAAGWTEGGVAGTGVYLRADFWNRIISGGSYGHTCYVAKELNRTSERLVGLLAQPYELLDHFGVQQILMEPPRLVEDESVMATATDHYYPILKTACQVLRPAYLYERVCLGNYAAALVSRDLKIPYLVEYNGSELSMQKSFEKATSPYRYHDIYLAAEALAFRQATAISVVSEIVKQDLVSRGVDARKILVNPNGADVGSYAPATISEKAAIRRELGFGDGHRVVGFTATFGGWHGVDVLAAAIPGICAASPDIRFLLIGDGVHKSLVDDRVAAHGLGDRVRAVGRVAQAEGARLLKVCDLYVAPHNAHMVDSRFFGSPTKIFEYMALSGGIVASDLEQIGQVLSPALRTNDLNDKNLSVRDERAVLCAPGHVEEFIEAVVALAARPELCSALGRNARQAVIDQFSWARHVERLWTFTRGLEQAERTSIETGEEYKARVQHQWDNTPVGSGRAKRAQPQSLEWFQEIEADRYGHYAPWMPDVMEFRRHTGQDVLEIGAGLGIDLAQFACNGARVTDVDLSSVHLALAQEHFRLRRLSGRFVHHDGEDLPFPDANFDVVYSNGVIHHTPNTAKMVDEIHRVLRPGGRVIVMVYAENSLHYWRNLVFYLGLKQGLLRKSSMGAIMSDSVEVSANGARPLVKVYTRRRLRNLFRCFSDITIVQRQMQVAEVPRLLRLRPLRLALERIAGWNLILKAVKPR